MDDGQWTDVHRLLMSSTYVDDITDGNAVMFSPVYQRQVQAERELDLRAFEYKGGEGGDLPSEQEHMHIQMQADDATSVVSNISDDGEYVLMELYELREIFKTKALRLAARYV